MRSPINGRATLRTAALLAGALLFLGLTIAVAIPESSARNMVRQDLIHLESEESFALVGIKGNTIREVDLANRNLKTVAVLPISSAMGGSISADGRWVAMDACAIQSNRAVSPSGSCPSGATHLAIIGTDGGNLREYHYLAYPGPMCWSKDDKKLALRVEERGSNPYARPGLAILDIESRTVKTIDYEDPLVGSQCWSPDGRQLVYQSRRVGGISTLRLYDLARDERRDLTSGEGGAWEPRGNRIVFQYCTPALECTPQIINANGSNPKELFAGAWGDDPMMWWPNSEYVFWEGFRTFSEHPRAQRISMLWPVERLNRDARLRVRRLSDGAEDWLVNLTDDDPMSFQWVHRFSGTTQH